MTPKQFQESLKKGTRRFIAKRMGLIFSVLFFLLIALTYYWGIKKNQHLSDKAFVIHDIENAEPINQLDYVSKFIRNEEFNLDRDFLTKTIHVKPHIPQDYIPGSRIIQLRASSIGLQENDSTLYSMVEKWQRINIPLKKTEAENPNVSNYNIKYDEKRMFLLWNNTSLASWFILTQPPEVGTFRQQDLKKLAGMDGDNEIYYLRGSLGVVSPRKDSISILPLQYEYQKRLYKDSIYTLALDKGVIDYKPYDFGLVFHSYSKDIHSLFMLYDDGLINEIIPDSVLNKNLRGVSDVSWSIDEGFLFFYEPAHHAIRIISREPRNNWPAKVYKNKFDAFIEAPQVLTLNHETIWLAGKTENGYGVAKIDKHQKNDTINIYNIPNYMYDEDFPPIININPEGLILFNEIENQDSYLRLFYQYKNDGNKPDSVTIYSFLDSQIVNNLSSFRIEVPLYSPNFEFFALSRSGLGAKYEIIPTKEPAKPVVNIIQDNTKEPLRPITWPGKIFFDVESIPDYFFSVILIIGLIIIYFFGLFYVLDYKNRDQPYDEKKLSILQGFPTLHEKLDYTKSTMGSLKLRSEVMLWLGIAMGVAGMFAFVFSLKTFFKDTSDLSFGVQFTVRMLRTFGIFSFMEVFSFYFLKQYRIVFNEYKRFYSLYLKIMNYFQYIESMTKYPDKPTENISYKDMRDAMLKDTTAMHDETNLEKINEFEKSIASDIVKTLAGKIPNP